MGVFVPSFRVLETDAPRPATLLAGSLISFLVLGLLLVLPKGGAGDHPPETATAQSARSPFSSRQSPSHAPTQSASQTASTGAAGRVSSGEPVNSIANGDVAQRSGSAQSSGQSSGLDAASAAVAGAGVPLAILAPQVDAAERRRVIDGAVTELKEFYIFPDVGQKMADALLTHERRGDDDAETDGQTFASLLTMQMREASHDKHLRMVYQPEGALTNLGGPTAEELARYRNDMRRANCTFRKVTTVAHGIGYVKFDGFPEASVCRSTVARVMASLNGSDALIFDLRENHGGDPHMVAWVASYLFDKRTHLNDIYNRTQDRTEQFWTQSPVPGNRLANKPVYVLTSAETFSGAEEFCYDLKNLKRGTLIGETTGGGAHPAGPHRIDERFTIVVPDSRPINPISKSDWEGTGVTPDVKVDAEDALKTAEALAAKKLRRR
jgi:hypothetical protein